VLRRLVAPTVAGLVLLAGWEVGVRIWGVPAFVLPPPSRVVVTAVDVAPLLGGDVLTTLTEASLGLLVGSVVGLLLAVLIAVFPWVSDTVYPLVTLTQTVPTVVLAPLLILWAGFGLLPKVVLVALTAFFPVLVASVTAMAAVEAEHAEMIAGLGGTRRHQLWLVQLPASVPGALGGLRVAATYAIGAAVVAEYLAGQSGLGVFIQRSRKGYEVDQILVAVALVSLLTGLLFLLVDGFARIVTPWQRPTDLTTRPGRTSPS